MRAATSVQQRSGRPTAYFGRLTINYKEVSTEIFQSMMTNLGSKLMFDPLTCLRSTSSWHIYHCHPTVDLPWHTMVLGHKIAAPYHCIVLPRRVHR